MEAASELKIIREEQRLLCLEREKGRSDLYRDVEELIDVPYMNDDDPRHTLDYYSPVDREFAPVIVVIHGGGYIACDKDINRIQARWFAENGFKVINGEYTLYPEADSSIQLQEISNILRWISENADMYGFDTKHIYITGDSAGGHLILLYTMAQSSASLQQYFNVTITPVHVRAAAASCPLDAVILSDKEMVSAEEDAIGYMAGFMFPYGASEEMIRHLDIKELIRTCEFCPVFVLTSPSDTLLGESSSRLLKPLKDSGREFQYKEYKDGKHRLEHVWNVTWPEWEESIEANTDIINFFKHH